VTDIVDGSVIPTSEACVILCACWSIWTERNDIWHGGGGRSITASVRWVFETTFDLAQLRKKKPPKLEKPKPRWTKPEVGTVKINVDACFLADAREGATGLVVRDHEGQLILGQALWYNNSSTSLIMEAEAVRDGVRPAGARKTLSMRRDTN
jgi:hypothetical protein